MKCKAVVAGVPSSVVERMNKARPLILQRVVGPHLKRPDIGSAGFYVQLCDEADDETHKPFCEVRLTGVSVTDDRSVQDFRNARAELEAIYAEILHEELRPGSTVELFVVLMLDGSPKPGVSPLIEGDVVIVQVPAFSVDD